MANEAVPVEGDYEVHDFTVADGATIEQNTLCQLADPRTASASDGANVFAGIAMTEKKADDGSTELGLATTGIFDLTCNAGAGITAGALVSLSGANLIKTATEAEVITGAAFGKALETATAGEVIEVKLGGVC